MEGRAPSDMVSDASEEHVIGNWRKGHPWYKVVKSLAELFSCSSVLRKVELLSNEIGYLVEEISKQSVEGVVWLLSMSYSNMGEEKNDLKMQLLV